MLSVSSASDNGAVECAKQLEEQSLTRQSSESYLTVAAANVFQPFCEDTRKRRAGDTQRWKRSKDEDLFKNSRVACCHPDRRVDRDAKRRGKMPTWRRPRTHATRLTDCRTGSESSGIFTK